jgi:transposase-like protein
MFCGNGIVTRRQQSDYARKLLKKQGFVPRVILTDKLKRYSAANKQVWKNVEHRQHKGLNHLGENCDQRARGKIAPDAAIQISRASATISLVSI